MLAFLRARALRVAGRDAGTDLGATEREGCLGALLGIYPQQTHTRIKLNKHNVLAASRGLCRDFPAGLRLTPAPLIDAFTCGTDSCRETHIRKATRLGKLSP